MHTRHLILKSILEGKRKSYSISSKFAYVLDNVDLKQYVDTFGREPKYQKMMDDMMKVGNELWVSFHGNGEPSNLKFDGFLSGGERVEFYVPVDDEGVILYWKVRKI